ncbi:NET domain [Dillenia turbinata]|uniref:NET domain n=1 Tax=Dillenia turbinata TaxID=194707 RepID=A0AAN8ZR70_9MAGN
MADEPRERERWPENRKVYFRKNYRKAINRNITNNSENKGNNVKSNELQKPVSSQTIPLTSSPTTTPTTSHPQEPVSQKTLNLTTRTPTTTYPQEPVSQETLTLATTPTRNPREPPASPPREVVDVTSDDDSSSLNHRRVSGSNGCDQPMENGSAKKPVVLRVEDRIRINLPATLGSKEELEELRRKLSSELDLVRDFVKKLEDKEVELDGYVAAGGGGDGGDDNANGYVESHFSSNGVVGVADRGGIKRVYSEAGSVGHQNVADRGGIKRVYSEIGSVQRRYSRPFPHLSVSVAENSHSNGFWVEKEKRTPKANHYYSNSDFILGKDRLPSLESNKKFKSNGYKKHRGEMEYVSDKHTIRASKNCSNLLAKLMKHKFAWVFNNPVDVKGLGLHDYYTVIKHPMDLGTVKTRLNKNWYKSPREFAEDVRLTFKNAMTYNPKGQDVHYMAKVLSDEFEEKWQVIEAEYNHGLRFEHDATLHTPRSRMAPLFPRPLPPRPEMRAWALDRSDSTKFPVESRTRPSNYGGSGRLLVPKKPKANDPLKRDMTYEEKQRLSINLQSLPSEKLDNIVQIIRKRNSALFQHDDEIEVDIDSVDAETLWELDRFVLNYRKNLSKKKRRAELALQAQTEVGHTVQKNNVSAVIVEAPKETRAVEEFVSRTSPTINENQGDNVSRSSSSSSSSGDSGSSSSDSDSDSSSGSDVGNSPRN